MGNVQRGLFFSIVQKAPVHCVKDWGVLIDHSFCCNCFSLSQVIYDARCCENLQRDRVWGGPNNTKLHQTLLMRLKLYLLSKVCKRESALWSRQGSWRELCLNESTCSLLWGGEWVEQLFAAGPPESTAAASRASLPALGICGILILHCVSKSK